MVYLKLLILISFVVGLHFVFNRKIKKDVRKVKIINLNQISKIKTVTSSDKWTGRGINLVVSLITQHPGVISPNDDKIAARYTLKLQDLSTGEIYENVNYDSYSDDLKVGNDLLIELKKSKGNFFQTKENIEYKVVFEKL